MNPIEICIAFVAAIVSVGTPLVFDAISKFDEKYGSEGITDLFEKKSKKKFFQGILVITSILIVVYIVTHVIHIHSTISFDFWFIEILTVLIIMLSSILVGIFIHFSFVTITFSRPSRLINFIELGI